MSNEKPGQCNTNNPAVIRWVEEMAALCQPDCVFWCDGSETEKEALTAEAVAKGILIQLNQEKLPGCYYHRSNPNDVARVEHCTYICTDTREEAGPTNNWAPPKGDVSEAVRDVSWCHAPAHPVCDSVLMGPAGSPMTKVGIELTDSIYVVLSMRIMARIGNVACRQLGDSGDFNRGLHSMLDVDPERRYICHFPQDNTILSLGSAYGGNVLLGKKCLALRIGSALGRKEGWMAEHMLIWGWNLPAAKNRLSPPPSPAPAARFPNFAMLIPPAHYQGWKIWTVGDDIAWMKPGTDGTPLCHQSRGRVLWRRARHEQQIQSQRRPDNCAGYGLHQCRFAARW